MRWPAFGKMLRLRRRGHEPTWQFVGATEQGKVRSNNEDVYGILAPKSLANGRALFATMVADGMGGASAGERMSKEALRAVTEVWDKVASGDFLSGKLELWGNSALRAANDGIRDLKFSGVGDDGSGSTGILVVYRDGQVYIFHTGDSPAFLVGESDLVKLTLDHDVESLTRVEGRDFGPDSRPTALAYSLGSMWFLSERYDYNTRDVKPGQIILTCSDGLTRALTTARIAEIINRKGWNHWWRDRFDELLAFSRMPRLANWFGYKDLLTKIKEELVAAYLASTAKDNATFVLARYA